LKGDQSSLEKTKKHSRDVISQGEIVTFGAGFSLATVPVSIHTFSSVFSVLAAFHIANLITSDGATSLITWSILMKVVFELHSSCNSLLFGSW